MLPTFSRLLFCTALSLNAVAAAAGANASVTPGGDGTGQFSSIGSAEARHG